MKMMKKDEDILEYISYLQRLILVHSRLYYDRDYNIISDREYDLLCKKLVKLKEKTLLTGNVVTTTSSLRSLMEVLDLTYLISWTNEVRIL